MNSTPDSYYLALDPAPPFADWMLRQKERMRTVAGEQRFLNDPPHLTLYVAAFDDVADVAQALDALPAQAAPEVRMHGWHTFFHDAGRNTLVCDLELPPDAPLRHLQVDAASAIAPLRNASVTAARYAPSLANFGSEERANLSAFGFPFVGSIWRPHLTVASVDLGDWEAAQRMFEHEPAFGEPIVLSRLALRRVSDSAVVWDRTLTRCG